MLSQRTVTLAVALAIVFGSVRSGSANEGGHLGWIPVQIAEPGTDMVLDLERFASGVQAVKAEPAGNLHPKILKAPWRLRVHIPGEAHGLFDFPLQVQFADSRLPTIIQLFVPKRTIHEFEFNPDAGHNPERVFVAGSFNGWNAESHPLKKSQNQKWSLSVPLPGGATSYKFIVDGKWILDPAHSNTLADDYGGINSMLTIEETEASEPVLYFDDLKDGNLGVRGSSNGAVQTRFSLQLPDGSMSRLEADENDAGWQLQVSELPEDSWIRAVSAEADDIRVVRWNKNADEAGNFFWQDAILYYAFTDRFHNGDTSNDLVIDNPKLAPQAAYHGGDFAGISQKIKEGYFRNLGINTLWLAPLNDNPDSAWQEYLEPHRWYSGYHGYWPIDQEKVEPVFGGEAGLKNLISLAHGNGIRVVADLVLKHAHIKNDIASRNPDWFTALELPDGSRNLRNFDSHPFTTWFEPFLPAFDFENTEATDYLNDLAVQWAIRFDLDGFRLDAVKQIPHAYWKSFRAKMRREVESKREAPMYFVGETFMDRRGIASFIGPGMLDAQFDFPLYDAIIDVIAKGSGTFMDLENALVQSEVVYGKETPMSPLVGNHDKSRFMAFADEDLPNPREPDEEEVGWRFPPAVDQASSYRKLHLAMAFILTIDGVPMIYYGDEIGMTGAGDPDNRRPMRFDDALNAMERETLKRFSKLTAIRHAHPALRYGSRRTIWLNPDTYAYVRAYLNDRVVVVFNKSEQAQSVKLDVSPELDDGHAVNLVNGSKHPIRDGTLSLELAPVSYAIFRKADGI